MNLQHARQRAGVGTRTHLEPRKSEAPQTRGGVRNCRRISRVARSMSGLRDRESGSVLEAIDRLECREHSSEVPAFSWTLVGLCQLVPAPHGVHRDLELLGDLTDRRPHDKASFTTCSRNSLGHALTCRLLIAGVFLKPRP